MVVSDRGVVPARAQFLVEDSGYDGDGRGEEDVDT